MAVTFGTSRNLESAWYAGERAAAAEDATVEGVSDMSHMHRMCHIHYIHHMRYMRRSHTYRTSSLLPFAGCDSSLIQLAA